MRAVIALIPMLNPKYLPIKFTITKSITPSTAFTMSLNNIFKGHENTLTNIYNPTIEIKKYPIY